MDIFSIMDDEQQQVTVEVLEHLAKHLQLAADSINNDDTNEASYQYLKCWAEFEYLNETLREYFIKVTSINN